MFWSTVDPRRRSVYTLKITEVHPKVVHPPTVIVNDITVAHDVSDPRYDAVLAAKYDVASAMAHTAAGQATSDTLSETSTVSATEAEDVDPARANRQPMSDVLRQEKAASFVAKYHPTRHDYSRPRQDGRFSRHLHADTTAVRRQQLGRSDFPNTAASDADHRSCVRTAPGVSRLSSSTLKLLGLTGDSSAEADTGDNRSATASDCVADTLCHDDLLLTMAKRLNDAAARSSKSTASVVAAPAGCDGMDTAQHRLPNSIETALPPPVTITLGKPECENVEVSLRRSLQTDGPPYHDSDNEDSNLCGVNAKRQQGNNSSGVDGSAVDIGSEDRQRSNEVSNSTCDVDETVCERRPAPVDTSDGKASRSSDHSADKCDSLSSASHIRRNTVDRESNIQHTMPHVTCHTNHPKRRVD